MWDVCGLFENDLWFKNTSGVLSWKFFCPGHSLLNPSVVCSLHCISWSYFRNLYGKLHASMEPWSCSIFPSVKIKWNRQKKDKYIVGDHESQLLDLFSLLSSCIYVALIFPSLSSPIPFAAGPSQGAVRWVWCVRWGDWMWWQLLKLFFRRLEYPSAFHSIQLAGHLSDFPLEASL